MSVGVVEMRVVELDLLMGNKDFVNLLGPLSRGELGSFHYVGYCSWGNGILMSSH